MFGGWKRSHWLQTKPTFRAKKLQEMQRPASKMNPPLGAKKQQEMQQRAPKRVKKKTGRKHRDRFLKKHPVLLSVGLKQWSTAWQLSHLGVTPSTFPSTSTSPWQSQLIYFDTFWAAAPTSQHCRNDLQKKLADTLPAASSAFILNYSHFVNTPLYSFELKVQLYCAGWVRNHHELPAWVMSHTVSPSSTRSIFVHLGFNREDFKVKP